MLCGVIIKKKNVLPIILLITIVPSFITDANCTSNMIHNNKEIINKNGETNVINLSYEKKINNKNTLDEYKQPLCDNNNIIKIETNINNILLNNNILSIDYVLRLLWNSYKNVVNIPRNSNQIHIISVHDNVIQQHINNIYESNSNLLIKENKFKTKKNINIEKRNNTINQIKNKSNSSKKILLNKFMEEEKIKFANNIEYIMNISKQHENIYNIKTIIDTYFKMQHILLNNKNKEVLTINTDYENISGKLNIFQQEVYENINSFYDSCLIGNNLSKESINDKIEIINNRIIKLETNPEDINNVLKIVSRLEIDDSKDMINKLRELQRKIDKLETNEKLKGIKNDLILLNRKIFNLILNVNLRTIKNNLNNTKVLKGVKTIIPTTNNILCWCSENYEDWAEILSQYEEEITDIFKNKINTRKINKREFANIFFLLHKVSSTNAKIENYYHTAKLLCNLSPIKLPYPIMLPRSLAV